MGEALTEEEKFRKYRSIFGGLSKISDACLKQLYCQATARVQQDGVEKNHVYYSLLTTYALGSLLASQGQLYGLGGVPPAAVASESIDGATRTYTGMGGGVCSYEAQYTRLLKSVLSLGYLLA